jgi:threonine/homoserine/homoserine lactone efflux protein
MENIIPLIAATAVLAFIPGPNVALIVANSLRHGLRFGLATVAGTTVGVAVQLAFVVLGLAALIETAAGVLIWIKWAGVAYLLYLGIRAWNEPAAELDEVKAQSDTAWRLFRHGAALASINPKTLLFNAAFLPQFISGGENTTAELMLVSVVFVAVLASVDMVWCATANSARVLLHRYGRLRNRMTAVFFLAAGAALALSRREV